MSRKGSIFWALVFAAGFVFMGTTLLMDAVSGTIELADGSFRLLILVLALWLFFIEYSNSFPRKTALNKPPGWRLRHLAEVVFSRKDYSTVFEPILRDLFDEYCEATKAGRTGKARWIQFRGYWSFWSAVAAQLPISAFKLVSKIWKAIP